jgi:hypothetical protein
VSRPSPHQTASLHFFSQLYLERAQKDPTGATSSHGAHSFEPQSACEDHLFVSSQSCGSFSVGVGKRKRLGGAPRMTGSIGLREGAPCCAPRARRRRRERWPCRKRRAGARRGRTRQTASWCSFKFCLALISVLELNFSDQAKFSGHHVVRTSFRVGGCASPMASMMRLYPEALPIPTCAEGSCIGQLFYVGMSWSHHHSDR